MFGHRSRIAFALCVLAAIAAGASATASRATSNAVACSLVSAGQLRAVLGLDHALVLNDQDSTSRAADAAHTLCAVGAWSGPTPTNAQEVLQTARSGRGAQVGVETWAPHEGSPDVGKWPKDYDKLTGGFDIEGVTFPGLFSSHGMPSKHFNPQHFGYQATALTLAPSGRAKGLVAAVGCWWNDKTHSAICLLDEEALGKPVVKHLNALAKIAVAKFL